MPLKKIRDINKFDKKPCYHTEHNPPMHIVLDAGEYEYTCPACGHSTRFTVPQIGWLSKKMVDNSSGGANNKMPLGFGCW